MGFILSYGEAVYSTTSLLGLASSEGLAFTAGEYFSTSLRDRIDNDGPSLTIVQMAKCWGLVDTAEVEKE